jgi:hypothetical protein
MLGAVGIDIPRLPDGGCAALPEEHLRLVAIHAFDENCRRQVAPFTGRIHPMELHA